MAIVMRLWEKIVCACAPASHPPPEAWVVGGGREVVGTEAWERPLGLLPKVSSCELVSRLSEYKNRKKTLFFSFFVSFLSIHQFLILLFSSSSSSSSSDYLFLLESKRGWCGRDVGWRYDWVTPR